MAKGSVRQTLRVSHTIPMQHGATPLAKGAAAQPLEQLKRSPIRAPVLKPGESMWIQGLGASLGSATGT